MRRRAPPVPTSVLDRLLMRLRREAATIEMEPDFPERVEAAIRDQRVRPRSIPRWVGVAAALLLAIGASPGPRSPSKASTTAPPARQTQRTRVPSPPPDEAHGDASDPDAVTPSDSEAPKAGGPTPR